MFQYQPVTLEEYNQTLRDTVNAYYAHAQNDPTMSHEEVLASTAQMSEQYLEATETFAAEAEAAAANPSVEVDTDGAEVDCGDDLDT